MPSDPRHCGYNSIMFPIAVSTALGLSLFLAGLALCFNRLVKLRNGVSAAWHGLETELGRRYAVIPRLAEAASGYASFESSSLELASRLRAHTSGRLTPLEGAEMLPPAERGVASFLAEAESYPSLKADDSYRRLVEELLRTESAVANARKYYNACVMHYDNARQRFPGNLVSAAFRRSFPGFPYLEDHAGSD